VLYLLYTLHVILCLFLILVVLLQQGKGADLSVFGGGATMTAFGARGATTLLHRLTVGGFIGFVLTTLLIAYMQANVQRSSVMTDVPQRPPATAPATTPGATEGDAASSSEAAEPSGEAPVTGEQSTPPAGEPDAPPPAVN